MYYIRTNSLPVLVSYFSFPIVLLDSIHFGEPMLVATLVHYCAYSFWSTPCPKPVTHIENLEWPFIFEYRPTKWRQNTPSFSSLASNPLYSIWYLIWSSNITVTQIVPCTARFRKCWPVSGPFLQRSGQTLVSLEKDKWSLLGRFVQPGLPTERWKGEMYDVNVTMPVWWCFLT